MTTRVPIDLLGGIPQAAPPALEFKGTSLRPVLAFDDTDEEAILFPVAIPSNYSSAGALVVAWSGSSSTTTSHTAQWGAQVMKYTPETDTAAGDSDSFATIATVDDDILGTTGKRIQEASITLTMDGGVADDVAWILLTREAAADDLNEDAWVWALWFSYTES